MTTIKGIFNRNNKEHPVSSSNEFDKQILRINALEVQIKQLLDFEKQCRASMYGAIKREKDERSRDKQNNANVKKSQEHSMNNRIMGKESQVSELSQRLEKLEKVVQGLNSYQNERNTHSLVHEKGITDENQLRRIVEQVVSEKLAEQNQARGTSCNGPQEDRGEWQEESESIDSLINMRVLALERNYMLVNEVQAGLIKRMDELVDKHNELLKKWEETEGDATQQNPVYKTLYIDKLYLDKYEQNNNFAQIGIRELSGSLNIGATYGKDVVPKKITEEAKAEIEKMKAAKEEMEKQQSSTDEEDKPQTDDPFDGSSAAPPEEEYFTDINIEDDPF